MPTDLDKLQGAWHITSLETDGRKMAAEAVAGATIVIEGTSFTSAGMGATYEGTMKVDETKKPKTFDLLVTAGHAAGTRHLGIYKLDGKSWTMCLAARGKRRPEKFATKAGTGLMLETLERGRAARKTTKAKPSRSLRPAARRKPQMQAPSTRLVRRARSGQALESRPPAQRPHWKANGPWSPPCSTAP